MATKFLSEDADEWLCIQGNYRHDVTLLKSVSIAGECYPHRIAIRHTSDEISYAELEQRSNQIARNILSYGIQRGQIVGVALKRGIEALIAMLGVMKSGAVYMPVDPDYPLSRRQYMIDDAGVSMLIANSNDQPGVDVICTFFQLESLPAREETPLAPVLTEQLAYIIYTSGSSGKPKGVAMSYRPLESMVQWHCKRLRGGARVLQFTSLSFDVSLQEIFTTWGSAGTLVVCADNEKRDATRLAQLLHDEYIERLFLPFAGLQHLATAIEEGAPLPVSLQEVYTAGEALVITPAIRSLFMKLCPCQLYNQYGPTESHVVVCEYALPQDIALWPERPPIGKALAGARLYILDEQFQPVTATDVIGEIFIGGDAVLAQGYIGQDDLTRERFVTNPFKPGERLYRTGDFARWDVNGDIHFHGRQDQQLKIRGHRVESGEVEATINGHPNVIGCAVITDRDGMGGMRLIACVTPSLSSGLTVAELRDYLEQRLPEFMLPSQWIFFKKLPLTGSFKLDRCAILANLQASSPSQKISTITEQALAEIWKDLLVVPSVSADDDFFALGGHSILATALLAAIRRRFNVTLTMSDIFMAPGFSLIARCIEQHSGQVSIPWPEIDVDLEAKYSPFPLSSIQQAYWLGREQIFGLGNISTHLYLEIEICHLDLPRLEWAWRQLISRHDMLRAVVLPDGQQQILKQTPFWSLVWQDLSLCGEKEKCNKLHAWRNELSHQVHDPLQWPLFDIRVSRIDAEMARLHISLDLLTVDALSQYILLYEWGCLYHKGVNVLPALPMFSFRDYQLTLERIKKTQVWVQDRDYWQKQLAELPPAPELPLICTPHNIVNPRFVRRNTGLTADKWSRIQSTAATNGVTPSAVLLALYAEVIARWSASSVFTLNLTLFNRLPLHERIDELVGDFTSTTLLGCHINSQKIFIDRVKQIQERLWRCLDHRLYSGIEVLRDLGRLKGNAQSISMPVVFTSALGLKTRGIDSAAFEHLGELHWSLTQTSQVWLDNQVSERNGELVCSWDALEDLFPPGVLDAMFYSWRVLLSQLAEDDHCWLMPLDVVIPQVQSQRHQKVNQTNVPLSHELLHTLFYSQSRISPKTLAVITPSEMLSYERLAQLSNGLAWKLRHCGCQQGNRVVILMDKGWQQIASSMAVMECGAIWLPLDPSQPARRQQQIIRQAGASILLVSKTSQPAFEVAIPIIVVDDSDTALDYIIKPLPVVVKADAAAYIIYTSGSTGIPKGVVISHRGAVNTLLDINRRVQLAPHDRVFALSALSFDLSVYDIFGTLAAGAAVVMPDSVYYRDPGHWLDLMHRHHVTLWNSVPALAQMLTDYLLQSEQSPPAGLRHALLSGDWIPLSLPDRMRLCWPSLNITSLGGATEASIWSIAWPIDEVDAEWVSIPYGYPLNNQHVYVLNTHLQDCPDWVTGDLYIGGAGLSLGYFNDEERTSAGFITHPQSGERLYRTGDRGRWHTDGYIEFLGRQDHQVKLAGYRIETGEVEWALMRCSGVDAAKVVLQCEPNRLPCLIAGVCGDIPDVELLLAQLSNGLPAYMIPSKIVPLKNFPLTNNGKLDTVALLALSDEYEKKKKISLPLPQTSTQTWLAGCWKNLLGVSSISIDSSFFSSGGDSLLATRLFSQIRARYPPRGDFSVISIFQYPTIRSLAAFLDENVVTSCDQQGRGDLRRKALGRFYTR